MTWQKIFIFLGALAAIVGQFWGVNYYLPLIGGIIALIGLVPRKKI
jgi:hypothetical protein